MKPSSNTQKINPYNNLHFTGKTLKVISKFKPLVQGHSAKSG